MPSAPSAARYTVIIHHLDPLSDLGAWTSLEYRNIAQECRASGWRCVAFFGHDQSSSHTDRHVDGGRRILSELDEQAGSVGLEILRGDKRNEGDGGHDTDSWEREVLPPPVGETAQTGIRTETDRRKKICLLDPKATTDLSPADAESFEAFVVGGILGDDPPRDRTSELRNRGYEGRRLGPKQMTTDTAARVTRMVIQDQQPLTNIPYLDSPEINLSQHESTQMPFRYVRNTEDGMPIMPEGMIDLIRKDADKGLDDILDLE